MAAVLQPTNAFPGIPFPQHGFGNASVTSYVYPGAVQPPSGIRIAGFASAFPGIPVPNHLSGQAHPQSYIYPGAVQPLAVADSFGLSIVRLRPPGWVWP